MRFVKYTFLGLIIGIFCPFNLYAAVNTDNLKQELALLKNQLQALEDRIAEADQSNVSDPAIENGNKNVNAPISEKKTIKNHAPVQNKKNKAVSSASNESATTSSSPSDVTVPLSWQGSDLSALITGSATAGFTKAFGQSSSFNILDFNPLLLFSYKDLLLLRSSIDFALDDEGNTNVSLDNINLNLFINDHATLGAGKFDSALGSFVQNISPAWVNRLPDSPVGFDADEAAPQSDIGARLQGGFQLSEKMAMNYVVFVANGPQALVNTTNIVIDHINTDGVINNNGDFFFGGRLGFLPIHKFEIGISAATGKVALIDMSDGTTLLQKGRTYNVIGVDAAYKPGNWDFRGEYIQQQVSSQSGSIVPQGEKWKAWYLQAAYWIPTTNFEPVIRYGRYLAAVSNQNQRQWAFGLDYWLSSSLVIQTEYEINDGQKGSGNNTNLFLAQLAFGF